MVKVQIYFLRTETVRSCTKELSEFVENFIEKKKSKEVLIKELKGAMEIHSKMAKSAMIGKGYDRHLFALSSCAQVIFLH